VWRCLVRAMYLSASEVGLSYLGRYTKCSTFTFTFFLQVNTPRLHPSQSGRYSIYLPGGMEGWVDLGDLLHTEMVYPPADSHPSKY